MRHATPGPKPRRRGAAPSALPLTPPPAPRSLQSAGRATWRRCWATAYWLLPADYDAVWQLARLTDERTQLAADVARDGATVAGSRGQPRPHPAVAMMRELDKALPQAHEALGLTPAARARLPMPPPPSRLELLRAAEHRPAADEPLTDDEGA